MKKKASQKPEPRLTWSKFPSIFRIITEMPGKIAMLTMIALVLSVIAISLELFVLYKNMGQYQKVRAERGDIIKKVKEWEVIVEKYKDYRDGYFYLASLEYTLGNFTKSRFYVEKSLQIDPNFDKARELDKILRD